MSRDPERWYEYLYERHSRAELAEWARSLNYFRYCRAAGGHANDGDELKVVFRHGSEAELRRQFETLGIPLLDMPRDAPRPVAGVSYRGDVWAKFLPFVSHLPQIRQPSHMEFDGVACHVWIDAEKWAISITDSDDSYEVTQRCVDGARRLEPRLQPLAHDIVDPPQDNDHCICPKFYPDIWY